MVDIAETPGLAPVPGPKPDHAGTVIPAAKPKRRLRLPLQLVAAASAIIFLALIVGLLSWQAYRSSQEALIRASNDTVGYIRDNLIAEAQQILQPAEVQLNFLAHTPLSAATTLPERLDFLPTIADALRRNALIDAMYIGYADGEFALFRWLPNDAAKQRLSAPDAAAVAIQSISKGADGEMIGEYRFYDQAGNLVGSRIDPAYRFDPRVRPWYQDAMQNSDIIVTKPYVFFTTHMAGLTVATRTVDGAAVIGIDINTNSLAQKVAQLHITPSADIAIVNRDELVIAYRDTDKMILRNHDGELRLATVDELKSLPLNRAAQLAFSGSTQTRTSMDAYGRRWQVMWANIDVTPKRQLKLLIVIPDDEFFASARQLVWHQLQIAGLLLLLSIPLIWWLTRRMVKPLRRLANETARIERFDFSNDIKIRSHIREINDLGRALDSMRRTIRKFLKIGRALAAERDIKPLLDRVLQESISLAHSDGGAIYLIDEDTQALIPEIVRWMEERKDEATAGLPPIALNQSGIYRFIAEALQHKNIVVTEQHLEETELADLGLRDLVYSLGATSLSLVIVPMLDRNQTPLGILLLVRGVSATGTPWMVDDKLTQLIHAVSGSASVAIQNKLLLEAQRKLIDSLIKLVAGAIDSKSAYTGGHCQRVPVLTRMLAEAAVDQKQGPYRDFTLNDEEWEALDIAAWLHDCGKVTTPEFVVDKATKLETIYDRIHEVRTRFEVMKRDAEIDYWRGLSEGGDRTALAARLEKAKRELDDDFAFIATCNEGGEFMESAKIERVKAIAARTWQRTISNRIGVSYEEHARLSRTPEPALPVVESLLSDRDDHIVELAERDIIQADNDWGFQLTAPKVKYNRGEIYNLSISRGTLTEEERYRINDHIVQTIIMLNSLPFPRHLKNVPELAGGHHEKMDGTGYPKRLKGGEMSVVARIMAIADVFEALTAADRPYKKAKKLSEAIKIMGFMKKDNHLDPDLLDLFLSTRVWRDYADRFLQPEQIDEPDINAVIGIRPVAAE